MSEQQVEILTKTRQAGNDDDDGDDDDAVVFDIETRLQPAYDQKFDEINENYIVPCSKQAMTSINLPQDPVCLTRMIFCSAQDVCFNSHNPAKSLPSSLQIVLLLLEKSHLSVGHLHSAVDWSKDGMHVDPKEQILSLQGSVNSGIILFHNKRKMTF